jgi:hypothetical protein
MTMDRSLCGICAWRRDCNKKFLHGEGIHCPDYTRDLTIRARAEEQGQEPQPVREKPGKKKTEYFKL